MRLSFVIKRDFVLYEVWSEIEEIDKNMNVIPNHGQM